MHSLKTTNLRPESYRKHLQEASRSTTSLSSMCAMHALPFGGVGEKGIGRYHGKYSYECFSHEKAVMEGSLVPEFEARYPPWNAFKLSFIRLAIVEDHFSLLLLMFGLKK